MWFNGHLLGVAIISVFPPFVWSFDETANQKPSLVQTTNMVVDSSASKASRVNIYEVKKDLLLAELSNRHNSGLTQENTLVQARIFLLTIIIAVLGFVYDASSENQRNHSRAWMLLAILSLVIFVYWYDSYVLDLQDRLRIRLNDINRVLNSFPDLEDRDVYEIMAYPDLTSEEGITRKLSLLWRLPNFAQTITYVPITTVLIVLMTFDLKRHYNSKRSEERAFRYFSSPE